MRRATENSSSELTVYDESSRIVNPLNIKSQMQRLETPFLPMRHCLSGRGDVRLREEQAAQPHLDVVQIIQSRDVVQLSQPTTKVCNPTRDSQGFANFVSPPVVRDGTCERLNNGQCRQKKVTPPLVRELMRVRK